MNTKRYKNAKWLDFEEIDNMEPALFSYLMKENRKRTARFEKYVHDKIMNMNPIAIEFLKELLQRLSKLKTQHLKVYHDVMSSSDRERKTTYYDKLIDKQVNKLNKFFQDSFGGKPHFYLTEYYIFNGDNEESGPQGIRQAILLREFSEKIFP